jgi:penicillin-binding protein 2
MLIFDQIKKNDPPLRMLAVAVLCGLGVLLAGLWWVQIVSCRDYQSHLETQSFRTVRIPAVRGKILDRNGMALAENQASYNLSLYLDELRDDVDAAYTEKMTALRKARADAMARNEHRLGRELSKTEQRKFAVTKDDRADLKRAARYEVASNLVSRVGTMIGQPIPLDRPSFEKHYQTRLALPYPVLSNLNPLQVAKFQEGATNRAGVDIDVQSTRAYPRETMAGHLLGALRRDDSSVEGEEASFSYWLRDYRGVLGIEVGYDAELRGRAGGKSVLVNNIGYRQTENVWRPAEAGDNVRLTLDYFIQQSAEAALAGLGPETRGAAVVLDAQSGDILALASAPTMNPNLFVRGFTQADKERLLDKRLRPQINRATQENYAPGSIFKIVTGLAALESGLNPNQLHTVHPHPHRPGKGVVYVGRREIDDLAAPGQYNFRRALIRSSNSYFIENGLKAGIHRIIGIASQFHLGERCGLPTRQETAGIFPNADTLRAGWSDGDTANICFGQGRMSVTPLQMAVVVAAVANGGNVMWPRLVRSIEPGDPASFKRIHATEPGRVRDKLDVRPENLAIIRAAMLADVEDPEGTGRGAALPGFRISGKTGTAQVTNQKGEVVDLTTWFVSFAPYDFPKYAVVVMVESGGSGGETCAPLARQIYQTILDRERIEAAEFATVSRGGGR